VKGVIERTVVCFVDEEESEGEVEVWERVVVRSGGGVEGVGTVCCVGDWLFGKMSVVEYLWCPFLGRQNGWGGER
jgi:hypothetical protein